MKFRLIPPGEFLMGSTPEEVEATLKLIDPSETNYREKVPTEMPRHKVILTNAFYLGAHEVTQKQYQEIMGTNPSAFGGSNVTNVKPKELTGLAAGTDTSDFPVDSVSWNDAAEFCAKLSQKEKFKPSYVRAGESVTLLDGDGYRLAAEAEWEYVCRAGTTTRYWSGDKDADLLPVGWFGKNSGRRTHEVGELKPNPFGLYDVHGNLWEWVQDWWEPGYYDQFAETPATDPLGAPMSAASQRVIRGGYWYPYSAHCRASSRLASRSTYRNLNFGFRVSLPVDAVRQALKVTGPAMPQSVASNTRSGSRETSDEARSTARSSSDRSLTTSATKTEELPATFTNSLGMEFVKVPKGTGWLGGGGGKPGEQKVEFTDDFYLGKYEVTQEEWEKVMGTNPSHFSRSNSSGKDAVKDIKDDDLKRFPVESMAWDECQAFCERLNKRAGDASWVYRLPTGMEWEYASRGGPLSDRIDSGFDFYFEKPSLTLGKDQANFNYALKRTCKVGSYKPNVLGLFDLHGNVWEWTDDEAPPFPNDPLKLPRRVIRGGAWDYDSTGCRAAHRDLATMLPSRNFNTGLRLARVRVSPSQPLSSGTDAPIDFAAERKAAEWVLKVGGTVWLANEHDPKLDDPSDRGIGEFSNQRPPIPAGNFVVKLVNMNAEGVDPRGFAALGACRQLRFLNLKAVASSESTVQLMDLKSPLVQLQIGDSQVTDATLNVAAKIPSLRILNVDGTRNSFTDAGLGALAQHGRLDNLRLSSSRMSRDGIRLAVMGNPYLGVLQLNTRHPPTRCTVCGGIQRCIR